MWAAMKMETRTLKEPPRIIAAGGAFGLNRNVVEVVGKQLFSKKKGLDKMLAIV
jgi:hypothetical protein